MEKDEIRILKIGIAVTYLAMVLVNALANILPINGLTTGQVSDSYPNLFAPAGPAFSIWGLIYILLGAHVLYQFGFFQKDKEQNRQDRLAFVGRYFILTSITNAAWIFAWHYKIIWLSAVLIATLLFFLVKIADILKKETQTGREKIFVRLPFSIYFGWITVATIANITVFLVSAGWNGFGIADDIWTVLILFLGAAIGIWRTTKDKNVVYGLVLVWAYSWIWVKHSSADGFNGQYPGIITAVTICMVLFLFAIGNLVYRFKIGPKK